MKIKSIIRRLATSISKKMEQLECLHTAVGSIKRYNHFGQWLGGYLSIFKRATPICLSHSSPRYLSKKTKWNQSLKTFTQRLDIGPSLVVQWLGICLPMQGTRDPPWFRNWDPTCLGATRPVCLNYRAHALPESACRNHWSPCPTREATATRSLSTAAREQPRFLQLEKAQAQKQRASVLHQRLNTANIFF